MPAAPGRRDSHSRMDQLISSQNGDDPTDDRASRSGSDRIRPSWQSTRTKPLAVAVELATDEVVQIRGLPPEAHRAQVAFVINVEPLVTMIVSWVRGRESKVDDVKIQSEVAAPDPDPTRAVTPDLLEKVLSSGSLWLPPLVSCRRSGYRCSLMKVPRSIRPTSRGQTYGLNLSTSIWSCCRTTFSFISG